VEKLLAHLGLPTERPVIAPARSPPQLSAEAHSEKLCDFRTLEIVEKFFIANKEIDRKSPL
jgi:hypothetical protein